MDQHESFSDSIYKQQKRLAERELSSFLAAAAELYGPEQARLAAADWLEELQLVDRALQLRERDWRAVTTAAAGRLASRVNRIAACASMAERFDR